MGGWGMVQTWHTVWRQLLGTDNVLVLAQEADVWSAWVRLLVKYVNQSHVEPALPAANVKTILSTRFKISYGPSNVWENLYVI
jgi:hypothetical protein